MKRFGEQFYTKSQSVKLTTDERRMLRERVVSYVEYHPMPIEAQTTVKGVLSPYRTSAESYRVVRIPLTLLLKWSGAVAMFVFVVIPVLAERAVPGDSLYAVKVRFNEEVRSTLTLNPYEKVEWETERLNRRLAEARLLASEGRLTEAVGVEMAQAVRNHTENVQQEIEVLRKSDADQATLASLELSTTLQLQSSSLQSGEVVTLAMAAAESTPEGNSTRLLADALNESLLKQADVASSSIPAYEKIVARVEINTTRAYELLNSLSLEQETTLRADIDRRLQDVNRSIEKAQNTRAQDEGAAQAQLLAVLERTKKLIVFMTDLELGKSIAIDSAVPIIPTSEEEVALTEQYAVEIEKKSTILREFKTKSDKALAEKIDSALTVADEKKLQLSTEHAFEVRKQAAEEALAYLNDAMSMAGITEQGAIPVVDTPVDPVATSSDELVPTDGEVVR